MGTQLARMKQTTELQGPGETAASVIERFGWAIQTEDFYAEVLPFDTASARKEFASFVARATAERNIRPVLAEPMGSDLVAALLAACSYDGLDEARCALEAICPGATAQQVEDVLAATNRYSCGVTRGLGDLARPSQGRER